MSKLFQNSIRELRNNYHGIARSVESLRLLLDAGVDPNKWDSDIYAYHPDPINWKLNFTGTVLEEAMKSFNSPVQVLNIP